MTLSADQADWREASLGEFIELKRGYDLPSTSRAAGSVPVVSSTGPSDTHDEAKVLGPGVVTGRYGTIGSVFYVTEDFWPLNTTLYVKDFKGNDPRFVSYFLKTVDFLVFSDKAAVPGVNRNHVHKLEVRFPPVQEQRRISRTLGALDDKIEVNRRISETLEEIARALFKSWFVDFDPVRGTATVPEGIRRLFPDRLVDSRIGPVPEGWEVAPLGEEFDVTMGQSPPGSTYNEAGDGLPFFQGRADFGFRFPEPRVHCSAPTRTARSGDTLLTVRAPVGDMNIADRHCCIGRGVAAIGHRTSFSFGYYLLGSLHPSFDVFNGEGTVYGSVSKKDLLAIPVVVPQREIVLAFHDRVSPMDALISSLDAESNTLAELRDTLLPKLLSGAVRLAGVPVAPAGAAQSKPLREQAAARRTKSTRGQSVGTRSRPGSRP